MRPEEIAVEAAPRRRGWPWWAQVGILVALCAAIGLAVLLRKALSANEVAATAPAATEKRREGAPFRPTPAQLATFTVETASERAFQVEYTTEGRITVDDDRTTPIFSPYSGRVVRLLVKQGDIISRGQVLLTIEATEMVQAQNDLLAATGAVNKARSQLGLAQTVERRQRELTDARATALKELQTAQNELVSAQNDLRAAETALEAVRNRLTILGKSEAEIAALLERGSKISGETPIYAPIAGTVISRKVGPGQFVAASGGDPVFTVGDLSRLWLVANVREVEAPNVEIGQRMMFRVLAYPDRVFDAKVTFVAAAVDPATRRVQVRAEVDNGDGSLKPEMFASIRIATGTRQRSPAVPREAVIYEADTARLWVVRPDGAVELRSVRTGLVYGNSVQILSGISDGERIVTRGSLFIDRLATGDGS